MGKTAVALDLANHLNAEVVSADARQVYRGLNIGTAKPTLAERARVTHHLIDLVDPPERYSAARFLADAEAALRGIMEKGRRAMVVGGTGLYFKALREGLFEAPETAPEVRERVDRLVEAGGREALAAYLERHDPGTLAQLDPANTARLRRAVEFHLMTDESLAARRLTTPGRKSPFRYFPVVLVRPREELYARIERRVEDMLQAGWVDEVRGLSESWDFSQPAFEAVGYRDLYDVVRERVSMTNAAQRIITKTRQYAKRQLTWFSHQGDWLWVSPENDVTLKIASGLLSFAENKSA